MNYLPNAEMTEQFGAQFAKQCATKALIFLVGNLGAGKTTFTRGFLRGLGYQGTVKSPTYTLVEPYEIVDKNSPINFLYHFDLYRLSDPEELEFLGIWDYLTQEKTVCLIEWAERGQGILPAPDFVIQLDYAQPDGRQITIKRNNS
jgi:tRNA threonylcarbamoyladenosine biosynthesis protein TsaE